MALVMDNHGVAAWAPFPAEATQQESEKQLQVIKQEEKTVGIRTLSAYATYRARYARHFKRNMIGGL
jgi:hypothetical protein